MCGHELWFEKDSQTNRPVFISYGGSINAWLSSAWHKKPLEKERGEKKCCDTDLWFQTVWTLTYFDAELFFEIGRARVMYVHM